MIPYRSRLATLVPKTWETRLEIIKAIGTLAAQSHEDHVRLRPAEVASLRGEFEAIARDLRNLCRDWPLLIRSELRKAGFDPNEPRVPAGHPDGGQWTSDSGGAAAGDSEVVSDAPVPTGYPAPNTLPTGIIGFQRVFTKRSRHSRRQEGLLKTPSPGRWQTIV